MEIPVHPAPHVAVRPPKEPARVMKIHIVLTGRGYQRGDQLPGQLELAENARLSDAVAAIQAALPDEESLPGSCLVAVAGDPRVVAVPRAERHRPLRPRRWGGHNGRD